MMPSRAGRSPRCPLGAYSTVTSSTIIHPMEPGLIGRNRIEGRATRRRAPTGLARSRYGRQLGDAVRKGFDIPITV